MERITEKHVAAAVEWLRTTTNRDYGVYYVGGSCNLALYDGLGGREFIASGTKREVYNIINAAVKIVQEVLE